MNARFKRLLLTVTSAPLLVLAPLGAELPEEVRLVLEKSVEASGGRELLANVESYRSWGTFTMKAVGMSGTTTMVFEFPDKVYMEQELPGFGSMVQAHANGFGWANDPMQGFRELSAEEIDLMIKGDSLSSILNYEQLYDSGELLGQSEVDGVAVQGLSLRDAKTGDVETHFYALEEGWLMKVEREADMGPMGRLPLVSTVVEYGFFEGIAFPRRSISSTGGIEVEIVVESVEVNPDVLPSLFAPPQ